MNNLIIDNLIKERAIESIREVAYREGNFVLRSGLKSTYYIDKYAFSTNTEALQLIISLFIIEKDLTCDLLAAPELGAIALTTGIALKVHKNFVIVRKKSKDYGASVGKLLEGPDVKGKKVILIEDILTTGGAAIQAAKVLRTAGAEVLRIIGTVDRLQGAQEYIEKEGFAYDSLLTINNIRRKI